MNTMQLSLDSSVNLWQRPAKRAQPSLVVSRPASPHVISIDKDQDAVKTLSAKIGRVICSAAGPSKGQVGGTEGDHAPQVLGRRQHIADHK